MLNKSPFRGRKFLASIGTKSRRVISSRQGDRHHLSGNTYPDTVVTDENGNVIRNPMYGSRPRQREHVEEMRQEYIREDHDVEVADKGDKDLPREGTKARRSITPMRPEINDGRRVVVRDNNGNVIMGGITITHEPEDHDWNMDRQIVRQEAQGHDVEVADKGDKSQPGHSGPGSVVSTRGGAGEEQHGTVSRSLPPILDSDPPVVVNVGGNHVVRGTHQVSEVAPNPTPRRKGVNPKIYGEPYQESEESRAARRASIPEGREQSPPRNSLALGTIDISHNQTDIQKENGKILRDERTPYSDYPNDPTAVIRGHSLKSIRQTYRKKAHGPYEDGYRARLASKPKEENPHTEESQQDDFTSHGFAWDNGWDTAHQDLSREDEKDEPFGYGQRRKLRRDQKKSVPGHSGIGSEVIIPEERARGRVVHVGDQNDENRMANVRVRRPGHGSPIRSVYDEDVAEVAPRRNQASLKAIKAQRGEFTRRDPLPEGEERATRTEAIKDEVARNNETHDRVHGRRGLSNDIPPGTSPRGIDHSRDDEYVPPDPKSIGLSQRNKGGPVGSGNRVRYNFTQGDIDRLGTVSGVYPPQVNVVPDTHPNVEIGLSPFEIIGSGVSPKPKVRKGTRQNPIGLQGQVGQHSLSYLDSTAGGSLVPPPAFGRSRTQRRWIKKGIKGGPIGQGQRVITYGYDEHPTEGETVSGRVVNMTQARTPRPVVNLGLGLPVGIRPLESVTPEPTRAKKPRVPKGRNQRQGNYHQERQNYPEAGNKAIEDMHSELAESGKRTDERAQHQLNYGRHAANTHVAAPQAQSTDEYNERVQNYEKPLNEMRREISRGEQEEAQIRERHVGDYLIHGKKIKAHRTIRTDVEDTPTPANRHQRRYTTSVLDEHGARVRQPERTNSQDQHESNVLQELGEAEYYDHTVEMDDQAKGKSIEPNETLNSLKNKLAKGETLTGDEICEFPNLLKEEDGNFAADLLKKVIETMNVSKGSETSKAAYIKQLIEHASSDVGKKGIKAAHVPGQPIKKGSKVRYRTADDREEIGHYRGNAESPIPGEIYHEIHRQGVNPNNADQPDTRRITIPHDSQIDDVETSEKLNNRGIKAQHVPGQSVKQGSKVRYRLTNQQGTQEPERTGYYNETFESPPLNAHLIRGGIAGRIPNPNEIIPHQHLVEDQEIDDVEPEAEADERMKKPEHGYRMEYREDKKSMNNGLKPEELQLLTAAILKAKMDGDDKAVEYLAGLANNPEELRKVTIGMDQPRNGEKSIGIKRIGPSPFRGRKGIQEPNYTQRRGARVSVDVYGNRVPAYVLGQNHEAGTTDVVTNEEPNLTVPHGQIIGQEPWQANWGRDDKKRRVREEQGNVD